MVGPTNTPQFAAVVLAAGLSSRMGGPNKLLMDYRGKSLLRHALDLVASLDLAQRVVVTGRDAAEISRIVPEGFEIAFNPRFSEGMGESIAAGVRVLRQEIDGVLIFLGDMPNVQTADVDAVISAFDPSSDKSIVIPAHEGQHGHPVLFARKHFGKLAQLSGDRGARGIVSAHPRAIIEVQSSVGVLRDVDSAADF